MRWVLGALALCFASFAGAPAWAQGTEAEPQAAPGSIGYGMIEGADAEGIFELVHNGQVTLRHTRSGLICYFPRDGAGSRLVIFEPRQDAARQGAPAIPRGDDVACDTTDGRESVTLYATRYSFQASLDEVIQGATAAIRHRYPDASELPANVQVTGDGLPAQVTRQFMVTRPEDGARMYTRASVAFVGEWAIKLRYTIVAPNPEAAQQGEIASGLLWSSTLSELTQERP